MTMEIRQWTAVITVAASLLAGCVKHDPSKPVAKSPGARSTPATASDDWATPDPAFGSDSSSATDWDRKLKDAFGSPDPTFSIGPTAPEPSASADPAAS